MAATANLDSYAASLEKQTTIGGSTEQVLYTSAERGAAYNCLRMLWCGCCEPYHVITTMYAKEDKWEGCGTRTDSMAMDNISDVRRVQTCCFACLGCFPCCKCCFPDIGDIILYGTDESQQAKHAAASWRLKHVANSKSVHTKITKHLQQLHETWRKQGRNLGQKLQEVKHNAAKQAH